MVRRLGGQSGTGRPRRWSTGQGGRAEQGGMDDGWLSNPTPILDANPGHQARAGVMVPVWDGGGLGTRASQGPFAGAEGERSRAAKPQQRQSTRDGMPQRNPHSDLRTCRNAALAEEDGTLGNGAGGQLLGCHQLTKFAKRRRSLRKPATLPFSPSSNVAENSRFGETSAAKARVSLRKAETEGLRSRAADSRVDSIV